MSPSNIPSDDTLMFGNADMNALAAEEKISVMENTSVHAKMFWPTGIPCDTHDTSTKHPTTRPTLMKCDAGASGEYPSGPVIGWQCALMRYIVPPVDEPIAGTFGWRYLPMSWAEFQSAPRLIS